MRRQQRLSHGPTSAAELAGLLVSVGSGETDPARAAELKDSVHQLCSGLADVDRRLIEMRLEGHTTAEAARAMDMDRQVLGVRLQRVAQEAGGRGPRFRLALINTVLGTSQCWPSSHRRTSGMRFVCLGFYDETKFAQMPQEDAEKIMEACFAYDDELRRGGHFLGGEAIESARNAVTLRTRKMARSGQRSR